MNTIVLEATDLKIVDILVTPNSKSYVQSYKSMNKFLWFKIPFSVPILMLRSSRMWKNFTTHGQLAYSRLCFNSFVLLIVYHWYKMSGEVHCKQFNHWCFQIFLGFYLANGFNKKRKGWWIIICTTNLTSTKKMFKHLSKPCKVTIYLLSEDWLLSLVLRCRIWQTFSVPVELYTSIELTIVTN